jgi:hypothetical protein
MSDLGNIRELLDAEATFASQTPEVLRPFAPQLLEAFDTAMGMYVTFGGIVGRCSPIPTIQKGVDQRAHQLGARDGEHLQAIRAIRPGDEPEREVLLQELQALETQAEGWMIRGIVFTQMGRAFAWSVADLMRMRITAATGYQRLVAEGFGLLGLMRDDPAVALAWRGIVSDDDGVAFYRRHQKRLVDVMARVGLLPTYERASGSAVHLRFAAAARGLVIKRRDEDDRQESSTIMLYQELRPDTAFSFIVGAVAILDAQGIVFSELPAAFPEANDPTWAGAIVPTFRQTVAALWGRFGSAFPNEIARLKQTYGPLPGPWGR